MVQLTPPPPAPAPHRKPSLISCSSPDVQSTLKDIKSTLERTKALTSNNSIATNNATTPPTITTNDDKRTNDKSMTSPTLRSPIWIPRYFAIFHLFFCRTLIIWFCISHYETSGESLESEPVLKNMSGDEEEVDTDLETDRLLGHQRLEDHGFYDDKV